MMCQRKRVERMSKQLTDILKRTQGPYVIRNQRVTRCVCRLIAVTGDYCYANYDAITAKMNDEI